MARLSPFFLATFFFNLFLAILHPPYRCCCPVISMARPRNIWASWTASLEPIASSTNSSHLGHPSISTLLFSPSQPPGFCLLPLTSSAITISASQRTTERR